MANFSKERRQEIVRAFAVRHNGQYDASLFLEEVRETGESHPAWGWFEWDTDKAARQWHLEQARAFASGLRVSFRVEDIRPGRPVAVRTMEMPMVISPMDGRDKGGGYVLTDPENPAHMAEHCRQAAAALDAWLRRYRSALEHSGGSPAAIETQAARLRAAAEVPDPVAA